MNALYNLKAAVYQSLGEAATQEFIGRNTDIIAD